MNHLAAQRRGFARGALKVYNCRCCGRATRPTGTGDNDGVQLCVECFDLAGEENSLSDNGEFYDSAKNILETVATVHSKGGNIQCWAHLVEEANKRIAAGKER